MAEALAAPREELNKYAPRIHHQLKPDQIRDIIGPGGKTIRGITAQTGVAIEVEDDGTVHIASPDGIAVKKAIDIIKGLTAEPEVGEFYMGVVKRLADFGASSRSCPAPTAWSTSASSMKSACAKCDDVCKEGDEMVVKVIGDRSRHGQDPPVAPGGPRQDPGRRAQLPHIVDVATRTPNVQPRGLRGRKEGAWILNPGLCHFLLPLSGSSENAFLRFASSVRR